VANNVTHVRVDGLLLCAHAFEIMITAEVVMFPRIEVESLNRGMEIYQITLPSVVLAVREMIIFGQRDSQYQAVLYLHCFPRLTHLVTNLDTSYIKRDLPQPRLEKVVLMAPIMITGIFGFLGTYGFNLREISIHTYNPFAGRTLQPFQGIVALQNQTWNAPPPIPLPRCETLTLNLMNYYDLVMIFAGCTVLRVLTVTPFFELLTHEDVFVFLQSLPPSLERLTLVQFEKSDCLSWLLSHAVHFFDMVHERLHELTWVVPAASLDQWLALDLPFLSSVRCNPDHVALSLSRMSIDKR